MKVTKQALKNIIKEEIMKSLDSHDEEDIFKDEPPGYAKSFIEKGVRRELDNTANMIRLPVNIMEAVKKMNYNEKALSQVLGRKPKLSEIATMMGVDENRVRQLQSYLMREPVSIEHKLNEELIWEDQDE